MENAVKKLAEVDFLDIYDEIAEIPITNDQVIKMCISIPCKVDLRKVNLVYLVEEKYKQKLSTYSKGKILKWLRVNLPRLLPNPEAKYLRWHERHQRKEKIEWINRKAQALQQLPPPINTCSDSETEGESSAIAANLANKTQLGDSITNRTNSTAATVETVIPSEPKSTQDIISGFLGLMNASNTTIDSYELPAPFSNTVSSTQNIDAESIEKTVHRNVIVEKQDKLSANVEPKKVVFQLSEEFSSQDDPYTTFSLDNMVTSTQEFG